MSSNCLVLLLEPRVSGGLPPLLEACKDITSPEILFRVLPIIVEGHSMNMPSRVLKSSMLELFHDFEASIEFPVIHSQIPSAPQAIQTFMAGFIGHLLKLKKRRGSDVCIAHLLAEVHARTQSLRDVPLEVIVPNAARLQLFTVIVEVVFCTIPLTRCPVGFGNTLNPVKITGSRLVQRMFERIEKLVDDILATYAPSTCDVNPPPYSK
ncbi:hypothetical protein DL96DRAFT_202447 [Flagelloscypha sp. PMI_526]|nr:hypothetical protein DL96DRAFT_202447 [Flagelloscypha sp. PMI_526]